METQDFKSTITANFYEKRITEEFNRLWHSLNVCGVQLNEEQIKETTILNNDCFKMLISFLTETGYFSPKN